MRHFVIMEGLMPGLIENGWKRSELLWGGGDNVKQGRRTYAGWVGKEKNVCAAGGIVLMRSISTDDHSSGEASWNFWARKVVSIFLSCLGNLLSPYFHYAYRALSARGCHCWPASDCASPRRKCSYCLNKQARTQEYLGYAPPVCPYQPTQAAHRKFIVV